MLILRLQGKAREVFGLLALLAREQGDKTLKELEEHDGIH